MIVSVPKETAAGERRVALTPDAVKRLVGKGLTVRIEQGAGVAADFPDDQYRGAGAEIATDAASVWNQADIVVMVQPPTDLAHVKDGGVVVGMFAPLTNRDVVRRLADHKVTAFSLELLPRITRAQPMDVLSSMSTVAGYKAVLLAAVRTGKFFPMLVTAAGTIPPAWRVFRPSRRRGASVPSSKHSTFGPPPRSRWRVSARGSFRPTPPTSPRRARAGTPRRSPRSSTSGSSR